VETSGIGGAEKTLEEYALEFRCSTRTVKRYRARGAPLHDKDKMIAWAKTQAKQAISDATWEVLREHEKKMLGQQPEQPQPDKKVIKRDWTAFKADLATEGPRDHQAQMRDLESLLEYYRKRVEDAIATEQDTEVKFWNELYLDAFNTLRQQKLAADKLGLEEGQLFSKDQLEKILRALAYWSMRSIETDIPELRKQVIGLTDERQAHDILDSFLLSNRFLKPFAKASRIESESTLAPWIAETMKDAVDDYIENGVAEFDKVNAT
jgi:hypothetical protein